MLIRLVRQLAGGPVRNISDLSKVNINQLNKEYIALKLFGKDWKKVEDHIGTRTGAQIRSHAQKYFLRIENELNGEPLGSHDHEDGSEDTFDKSEEQQPDEES